MASFQIRLITCLIIFYYSKVAVYGPNIRYESSKKEASRKSFWALKKIACIIFASFVFLIEEVQNVFLMYKESKLILSLREKNDRFLTLSLDEKNAVRDYFNARIRQLDGAQRIICRESSIQVVLQLTLILYQANYQEK